MIEPPVTFCANADSADILAAIRQYSVALIRGALPADAMVDLGKEVAAFYAKDPGNEWIVHNGLAGPNLGEHLPGLFEAVSTSVASASARFYLEGDPVVPLNHMLFRQKAANAPWQETQHTFHQDHDLIPHQFPMNMWVPLSTVDESCLALSFVLPPSSVALKLPIDIDAYLASTGGYVWTPDLEPGDFIIFNNLTIHGSYLAPKPRARYSVEFRLGRQQDVEGYAEPIVKLGSRHHLARDYPAERKQAY